MQRVMLFPSRWEGGLFMLFLDPSLWVVIMFRCLCWHNGVLLMYLNSEMKPKSNVTFTTALYSQANNKNWWCLLRGATNSGRDVDSSVSRNS